MTSNTQSSNITKDENEILSRISSFKQWLEEDKTKSDFTRTKRALQELELLPLTIKLAKESRITNTIYTLSKSHPCQELQKRMFDLTEKWKASFKQQQLQMQQQIKHESNKPGQQTTNTKTPANTTHARPPISEADKPPSKKIKVNGEQLHRNGHTTLVSPPTINSPVQKKKKRVSWAPDDLLVSVRDVNKTVYQRNTTKHTGKLSEAQYEKERRIDFHKSEEEEWKNACRDMKAKQEFTYPQKLVRRKKAEVVESKMKLWQEERNQSELMATYLTEASIPLSPTFAPIVPDEKPNAPFEIPFYDIEELQRLREQQDLMRLRQQRMLVGIV